MVRGESKQADPRDKMSAAERTRYDKAQVGLVPLGYDYRLAMIALQKNGEDPNAAAEWLMLGGSAVEAAERSIQGTSVTFTTPAPLYHSSAFVLEFQFGSETPYAKGEWIGLYPDGRGDKEVDRMCVKVDEKARRLGRVTWPRSAAPSEGGQYTFRYFQDSSCNNKQGTSAPVTFETRSPNIASVTTVADWLADLLPHREALEALCGVANEYAARTAEDPALVNKDKAMAFLRDTHLAAYPALLAMPLEDRRRRFRVAQQLNSCLAVVAPAIDLTESARPWRLGWLLAQMRGVLFSTTKERLLSHALGSTSSGEKVIVELYKQRAAFAREHPDGRGTGTMFAQLVAALRTRAPRSMRLAPHHEVWGAKYVGFGADDAGGAYNESISELCEELHSRATPLFLPTWNFANKGHAECWQPSPGALGHGALEQWDFLGTLLGIALRTRHPVGLTFPMSFWRYLAAEPRSLGDLHAVDELQSNVVNSLRGGKDPLEDIFSGAFVGYLSDSRSVELVPRGAQMQVTERTREVFAALVEDARVHEADLQMTALMQGMSSIIPTPLLRLFTSEQVERLVCGARHFDLALLKSCTTYEIPQASPEVGFLWRALESFTEKEQTMFLRFVRAINKMPLRAEDFKYKMNIVRYNPPSGKPDAALPHADTCFFRLKLPKYTKYEALREKLLYAIANCPAIDTDFAARGGQSIEAWRELENPTLVTF